jgi:hypothetical protein
MSETYVLRIGSVAVPSEDFIAFSTDRRVASLFDQLSFGTIKLDLDNSKGRYTPARSFSMPAVKGDGTDARLARGGELTDAVSDAKVGFMSFHVRRETLLTRQFIAANTGERFLVEFTAADKIRVVFVNAAGTTIGDVTSDDTIADTDWHHVLISWDLAATNLDIFIDEVESGLTVATALANDSVDYTRDEFAFFASTTGTNAGDHEIANVILDFQNSFDFTVEQNRRLFLDEYGKGIFQGEDGSRAIPGFIPTFYLTFSDVVPLPAVSDPIFNRGGGGDLAITGSASLSRTDQSDVTPAPVDLRAGRGISLDVTLDTGSTFSFFQGTLDRTRSQSEPQRERTTIDGSDIGRDLARRVSAEFLVDTNPSSAVAQAMTSIGITVQSIDLMPQKIPFADLDLLTGGEVIQKVIEATAGFAYISGDGALVFKDRNFDFDLISVASLTTFYGFDASEDTSRLINKFNMTGESRSLAADLELVAQLVEPVTIPSSTQIDLLFEYKDFDNDETGIPVQSVKGTIDPGSDFSFTDNNLRDLNSVLITSVQVFARSALVSLLNGSAENGFLAGLELRGYPLRRNAPVISIAEAPASTEMFGVHEKEIVSELIADPTFARNYAEFMMLQYSEPQPTVDFGIKNQDPAIYDVDLLTRVTLVESLSGVFGEWTVTGLRRTARPAAADSHHTLEITANATIEKPWLILDHTARGKLDNINKLGF